MTDKDADQGKVEIKIGNMSFSGEGSQEWLDRQVTKLLQAAATGSLGQPAPAVPPSAGANADQQTPGPAGTMSLASYLKAKGGDSKQVVRFLATAAWLRGRGERELTTAAVTKALADNHQKRLANPADCLNKNVSKGYCEKYKTGFFITPEGLSVMGEE